MPRSVRDDPGIEACAVAIRSILDALPEGSYVLEEEVVRARNRRGKLIDELLAMTITPTRDDAARIEVLLPVGGDAYLLTGSGERQSRFEFLRAEVPLGDQLAAMVEAVAAGRIEDDVTFGRNGRVVRQRTVIELADGTEMPVTAGHQVLGLRNRREQLPYRPYA